jgi:hypothetical protein
MTYELNFLAPNIDFLEKSNQKTCILLIKKVPVTFQKLFAELQKNYEEDENFTLDLEVVEVS